MLGRGRLAVSTGTVPCLLQFHPAPCELAPAIAHSRAYQRHGLSQAVAVVDAGNGGRLDRPRVDAARRAALSRATMAAATGGVSGEEFGEREEERIMCALSQETQLGPGLETPM